MRKRWLGVFVAWFALGAATPAKHRAAAPVKGVEKPDPVKGLAAQLVINSVTPADNLWAKCLKSNFKGLAAALDAARERISSKKGEFETQDQFTSRTRKIEDIVNEQGQIIICQDLSDNKDATFIYDADSESFSGSFGRTLRADLIYRKLGSYNTKTRMGVPVHVTRAIDIEYSVDLFDSIGPLPVCLGGNARYGDPKYTVKVRLADAPNVKRQAYLVFEGRLVDPFIASSDSPGEPSLDNPNDVFERDYTVKFSPSQMAVVMPDGSQVFSCSLTQ